MNPGQLNERCLIEYPVETENESTGETITEWETLATRWCEVQDVLPSRAEKQQNNLVVSQNSTRLRMRFCTDIDSTMRGTVTRGMPGTYQIIAGPAILGNKEFVEFMIERISTQ